jgi:predicted aldo/keto reductase-like oxidoreductase
MQYREFGKLNLKPSVLGFGAMRLPVINDKYGQIDYEEAKRMLRYAIDNGVNYIDTAWTYHEKTSELFIGEALKDGYREKVMLATKNPIWLINEPDEWDRILDQQLTKLQTDYIDFYLQHSLDKGSWNKCKEFNLWDKAMEAKKAGKIKYIGFSFHDSYDVFEEIIDTYDWDFCQIQLNYLDTDYQAGIKGLEKAASKNIGVVIMEPLKGGRLATGLPEDLLKKMEEYKVKRSPVEWALRWLANRPEVSVILSGMSTFEQVEQNIRSCSSPDMAANKMSDEELSFITDLANEWKSRRQIGCTGCNYCMPCPNDVFIPDNLSLYNLFHSTDTNAQRDARKGYKELSEFGKGANNCIECGLCEDACPQHLPIMKTLSTIHDELKP